jgi:hypothetical protein
MTQPIPPKVKLAAAAIRECRGACHKRDVGCDYCFSRRYHGCVYLAEQVCDALFPTPGSNGGGGNGIKERKTA